MTKYSTNREILSKFKTRTRQYFYIADPRYPGKMLAAIYDPEGGAPIIVGAFPRMKTRQQLQWLSVRLDRLVSIFADFQALTDYQIMLAEELVRLDPTGLDLTPGERSGWAPDHDGADGEYGDGADDGQDDGNDLMLPMRMSMIRKKRKHSGSEIAPQSRKQTRIPIQRGGRRGPNKKTSKRFL